MGLGILRALSFNALPFDVVPFEVPVDPDAPEAQQLLADELAKAEYQNAKPSWFDLLMQAILDWINSLEVGQAQGPPAVGLLVVLIVVVALLVIAFLVFGLPRINRRSAVTGALFGVDDERSAAKIRAAALVAAGNGDYALAIVEMFRSIARGLSERTVLTTTPGTTAHDFALHAGRAFPDSAERLASAATAFDGVRYLDQPGTKQQFDEVDSLERALRYARAALDEVDA